MLVEKSGCGDPPIPVQVPACAILSASLVVWGVLEPSGSPTSMPSSGAGPGESRVYIDSVNLEV